MKQAASILALVVVAGCSSTARQPISGRYALLIEAPQRTALVQTEYGEAVRRDLAERGATVDVIDQMSQGITYDATIVISADRGVRVGAARYGRDPKTGILLPSVSSQDVSGTSDVALGKLSYRILRGGVEIASGAVNRTIVRETPDRALSLRPSNEMLAYDIQAAHALASEIAKRLTRS
jgi:hypothetical protein